MAEWRSDCASLVAQELRLPPGARELPRALLALLEHVAANGRERQMPVHRCHLAAQSVQNLLRFSTCACSVTSGLSPLASVSSSEAKC